MLLPSGKSGYRRFTTKDYARTIVLKTHTSRFGGERENSSGSSRPDQLNGSCRSTPLSTVPSTSNAIFCHAVSSRCFELMRWQTGIKAAAPCEPEHGGSRLTRAVNVSMPPVCEWGLCIRTTPLSHRGARPMAVSFLDLSATRHPGLRTPSNCGRVGRGGCFRGRGTGQVGFTSLSQGECSSFPNTLGGPDGKHAVTTVWGLID